MYILTQFATIEYVFLTEWIFEETKRACCKHKESMLLCVVSRHSSHSWKEIFSTLSGRKTRYVLYSRAELSPRNQRICIVCKCVCGKCVMLALYEGIKRRRQCVFMLGFLPFSPFNFLHVTHAMNVKWFEGNWSNFTHVLSTVIGDASTKPLHHFLWEIF